MVVGGLLVTDALNAIFAHGFAEFDMADIPRRQFLKGAAHLDHMPTTALDQMVGRQQAALLVIGRDKGDAVLDEAVDGNDGKGNRIVILVLQLIVEQDRALDAILRERMHIVNVVAGIECRIAEEHFVVVLLEATLQMGYDL